MILNNFDISKEDWGPFGYAVQKAKTKKQDLGPKTLDDIKKLATSKNISEETIFKTLLEQERVLCLHNYRQQPFIIHTDYLLFLKDNFIINPNFIINHIIEFVHSPFLNSTVTNYLERRKVVKDEIANLDPNLFSSQPTLVLNLKNKSSMLKLFNNSIYGYSILRSSNYTTTLFVNNKSIDNLYQKGKSRITCSSILFRDDTKTYFCVDTVPNSLSYSAMHIGSAILFLSKTIFLTNVHFLLKHLNPKKSMPLYCDTDSVHFLLHNENLEDNLLPSMRKSFFANAHKHLGGYPNSPICGVLELEGTFPSVTYRGEKIYQKQSLSEKKNETTFKGVPSIIKKKFLDPSTENNPFNNHEQLPYIAQWKTIRADSNFNMYIAIQSREMGTSLIPVKRHFFHTGHSNVFL